MARILIAEDESMLCDMCARALADDGHEVEMAHDGTEALDVLTKYMRSIRPSPHRRPHAENGRHRSFNGCGA